MARSDKVRCVNPRDPFIPTIVLEALQRERLPGFDLTDDLTREARTQGSESLIRVHFTPEGNRLAADAIYAAVDWARRHGWCRVRARQRPIPPARLRDSH